MNKEQLQDIMDFAEVYNLWGSPFLDVIQKYKEATEGGKPWANKAIMDEYWQEAYESWQADSELGELKDYGVI